MAALDTTTELLAAPLRTEAVSLDYDEAIAEAVDSNFLGEREAANSEVEAPRPQRFVVTIGQSLRIEEKNLAKLYSRAMEKFRVFMFLARPDLCGSRSAIKEAFEAACRKTYDPLSSNEQDAFQAVVLERSSKPTSRGYWTHIRTACTKVAIHLDIATRTEVTP